jgi:hypothetical protein
MMECDTRGETKIRVEKDMIKKEKTEGQDNMFHTAIIISLTQQQSFTIEC